MQTNEAKSILDNCFNNEFNEENFKKLIIGFLGNIDENKKIEISGAYIPDSFKEYVKSYKRIGQYTDKNDIKIDILAVKLKKETSIDRARTMQRNFIAEYLKKRGEKEAAIVAYYTEEIEDWRFSFVKMDYNLIQDEKGILKIREEKTPAKRFSFLVGSNEPNHTAKKQLLPHIENNNKNISIQEIENIFDIESINKEFFEKYKKLFELLNKELERITINNSSIKKEFESKNINIENFSKKLLGQVVFLYFLQKKGWLGVGKDETGHFKNWNEGRKDFLRALFEKEIINYNNFFNDVLEPLFYEALATERDNDYYSPFNCKIPFLNGGLFDPINNYNWQETDILIDDKVFKQIFDTFDLYNFTVKEDEPLEREVALDPEMLGVVFEKLLDKENQKAKGAFYTPREIVHYMCQESLINFIYNETENKIKREDIEKLVHLGDRVIFNEIAKENGTISYINELSETIRKNAKLIDDKLANIKVCDPAIGSGAFPVGIMIEIVKIRDVLTTYLENKEGRSLYELKRNAVENSIYGVDIEEGAVEIAKLRLWLSLVVDENDFKNIKPLPNLDYKIMCGNSLLEELVVNDTTIEIFNYDEFVKNRKKGSKKDFENIIKEYTWGKIHYEEEKLLEHINTLHKLYINENRKNDKKKIKKLIDLCENYLVLSAIKREKEKCTNKDTLKKLNLFEVDIKSETQKTKPYFLWKWNFMDVFDEKGGFDIVIGNPPYVGEKGNKEIFRPIAKGNLGRRFYQGKVDLFYFFFHLGLDLLKNKGNMGLITTNYYITADGAKNLRKDFKERSNILKLINFNEITIFETAKGQHNLITILEKSTDRKKIGETIVCSGEEINLNEINEVLAKTSKKAKYYCMNQNEFYYSSHNKIRLNYIKNSRKEEILNKILKNGKLVQEICNVNSGADITISRITNKHLQTFKNLNIKKGEGVFVINPKELSDLNLDNSEMMIIKPFIKNSNIDRYIIDYSKDKLIYLKWEDDIELFPKIKLHLERFKEIFFYQMKKYEETYPWFALHRPRDENIFLNERIIVPYRAKKNIFGYSNKPAYSSRDVFFITQKNNTVKLKYLLGILNSKLYFLWLYERGKRKGEVLELYATPLKDIPIKDIREIEQQPFIDKVEKIIELKKQNQDTTELENQIDEMVYDLYELTEEEKNIVRNFKN